MKILKKTLPILLCLILLSSFAPMVYAQNELISQVSAEYKVPAADEQFDFSKISVPDDAHYSAIIYSVYYWDNSSSGYVYVSDGDVVVKGVSYYVRIKFTADSGYTINDSQTQYYINGEKMMGFVGTHLVEDVFVGTEKVPEEPEQPTLLQRIANFFRKIANFFRKIFRLPIK